MIALSPRHQSRHQLSIDMKQRQATKDNLATAAWLHMSSHGPCIEYFRAMTTRGDLREPCGVRVEVGQVVAEGLIGVLQSPLGFVAILGIIALGGMIIRNSVILIDQVQTEIAEGRNRWSAVLDAAIHRPRPVMLTVLATVLAMIPLTRSVFWGPMAIAIMGALTVATLLTIFFVPALYAAWFKVGRQTAADSQQVMRDAALASE